MNNPETHDNTGNKTQKEDEQNKNTEYQRDEQYGSRQNTGGEHGDREG